MIISVFPTGEVASYCLPLPNIIHHIKTGTYKELVGKARQYYQQIEPNAYLSLVQNIPAFSPAGHFRGLLDRRHLVSYSSCVLLETMCIPPDLLAEVRAIVEADHFTLACFQNLTGDRLAIIVQVEDTIHNYRFNYYRLMEHFGKTLPVAFDTEVDYPYQLQSMSFDPFAFYYPDARVFPAAVMEAPPPTPEVRKTQRAFSPVRIN